MKPDRRFRLKTRGITMKERERTPRAATARALLWALAWAIAFNPVAQGADGRASAARAEPTSEPPGQGTSTMKIRLTVNGKAITASLIDNPTVRDFLALLPMTLTLEDYARTEKISYLPRKLSTVDAPAGSDPSVGDITYYAPWGNLAIFYKDFRYSSGLIPLGRIDSGIEALAVPGPLKVTIEPVGK
jgi:hypothetical protein